MCSYPRGRGSHPQDVRTSSTTASTAREETGHVLPVLQAHGLAGPRLPRFRGRTLPPAPDAGPVLGNAGVEDPRVRVLAVRAEHGLSPPSLWMRLWTRCAHPVDDYLYPWDNYTSVTTRYSDLASGSPTSQCLRRCRGVSGGQASGDRFLTRTYTTETTTKAPNQCLLQEAGSQRREGPWRLRTSSRAQPRARIPMNTPATSASGLADHAPATSPRISASARCVPPQKGHSQPVTARKGHCSPNPVTKWTAPIPKQARATDPTRNSASRDEISLSMLHSMAMAMHYSNRHWHRGGARESNQMIGCHTVLARINAVS